MHKKEEKTVEDMLEKMWNDYFADECSRIDSDQERALVGQAIDLHDDLNDLLSEEECDVMEKYVDILCDINALYAKTAFLTGCKFAVSFFLEARNFKKSEDVRFTELLTRIFHLQNVQAEKEKPVNFQP